LKAYIVLDELGVMYLKNERYFVIGGFITNDLHKVTSSHKEIVKIVKLRKGIPINKKIWSNRNNSITFLVLYKCLFHLIN